MCLGRMSCFQPIAIIVILTYHVVFVGPNYDAGVGIGVGVEKGVVVIISRFKLSCACLVFTFIMLV